jgi:hypothetical protein
MHDEKRPDMRTITKLLSVVPLAAGLAFCGWLRPTPAPAAPAAAGAPSPGTAHVVAKSDIEAGRYLVVVQGCNDCHTPGWNQLGTKVPESKWLIGNPVGFKGPWGTSYAFNLRNYFSHVPVDKWVQDAHKMHTRPPMPWMSVRAMSEPDLRSMYAFIHSLGQFNGPRLHPLKPGVEPNTPYVDMEPRNPSGAPSAAPSTAPKE